MMRNARKIPLCNLRTTQALISLRISRINGYCGTYHPEMPRLDFTDAHADLDLRCPQTA